MTDNRWAGYKKNNGQASQVEHLRSSDQWKQTVAQPGCHNCIPVFIKENPLLITSCTWSSYFSNVKPPPVFPLLSCPVLYWKRPYPCLLRAFGHTLPFCLPPFPALSPPESAQCLFSPQASGGTSLPPGSPPDLGAHFKVEPVQHLAPCKVTACLFAGLLTERVYVGYYASSAYRSGAASEPHMHLAAWVDGGSFFWLASLCAISHLRISCYILEVIKHPFKPSSRCLPFYHFPLNTHM